MRMFKLLITSFMLLTLQCSYSLSNEEKGLEVKDVLGEKFDELNETKIKPHKSNAVSLNVTEVKYQTKEENDLTSIRLLAGISSYNVDKAGFYIEIDNKELKVEVTKAYERAIIDGKEKSAFELFKTDYLIAYVIKGVSANKLNSSYVVSSFLINNDKEIRSAKREYSISNYDDVFPNYQINNFEVVGNVNKIEDDLTNGLSRYQVNNNSNVEEWQSQLLSPHFNLINGEEYTLVFKFKSSISRNLRVIVQSGDYANFEVKDLVTLKEGEEHVYSKTFKAQYNKPIFVGVLLGNIEGNYIDSHEIEISNFAFRKKIQTKDISDFSLWNVHGQNGEILNSSLHSDQKGIDLTIKHNSSTNTYWHGQVKSPKIKLDSSKTYRFEIVIRSSISRKINVRLENNNYNYNPIIEDVDLIKDEDYLFVKEVNINSSEEFIFGIMLGLVGSKYEEEHLITLKNFSYDEVIKEEDNPSSIAPSSVVFKGKELRLDWNDEFNGDALDETKWTHEVGNGQGGWGNNELQYYQPENTTVSDGYMTITAKKEVKNGFKYTSSRIISKGKYSHHYGYSECRLAMPKGNGIWPAYWMLGSNIDTYGWPKCGEIDIMEAINSDEKFYSTIHFNVGGMNAGYNHAEYGNRGVAIQNRTSFHVFGLYWDEEVLEFYYDGTLAHTVAIANNANMEMFHFDHFFLFNVAVGGNWPGHNIDESKFPHEMKVDYLRVYKF